MKSVSAHHKSVSFVTFTFLYHGPFLRNSVRSSQTTQLRQKLSSLLLQHSKLKTSTEDHSRNESVSSFHRIIYYARCILTKTPLSKIQLLNFVSSGKLFLWQKQRPRFPLSFFKSIFVNNVSVSLDIEQVILMARKLYQSHFHYILGSYS